MQKRTAFLLWAIVGVVSAMGTAWGPAVAEAAPSGGRRVEEMSYQSGDPDLIGAHTNYGVLAASITLPPGPERFVEIEINDATGQPVSAMIQQGTELGSVCGSTGDPVAIYPNMGVTVDLFSGRCTDATPSVVTQGTVTATFLPKANASVQSLGYSPYVGAIGVWNPEGLMVAELTFPALLGSGVSMAVADQSGVAVYGMITQDDKPIAEFCGATDKPVAINRYRPVQVRLFGGVCPSGGPSVATRGTVTARFSNR